MRTVKIAEVCKQSTMQALIVEQDMQVAEAVQEFATNHDLRGFFLTDENGRLSGVINKQDLLDWMTMQLNQRSTREPMSVGQMRRLLNARRVADLAAPGSEQTAVRLDDTLADALEKMTYYKLSDIPVVDEEGRIVNDLRLSEVLAFVLNASDS